MLFNFSFCLLGHIFSAFMSRIWSPGRLFVNFDFGEKGLEGAHYSSTQYGAHNCFAEK